MLLIFHCSWAIDGCMGVNAVVVANGRDEALKMLDLDDTDKCQQANFVGEACASFTEPTILARESL